jgi:hypothetical protein
MKAHEEFIPWDALQLQLKAFKAALDDNDVGRMKVMLAQLVAGYASNSDIVDWIFLEQEAEAAPLKQAV